MNHKGAEDTEKIQDNVFELEDADNWGCTIEIYVSGHSQLVIRAYNQHLDKSIRISFHSVEYFSGAMNWVGANFHLHSRDECTKFLSKYRPPFQKIVKMLKDNDAMDAFYWKLYSIPTKEGNTIQIIAAGGSVEIQDSV